MIKDKLIIEGVTTSSEKAKELLNDLEVLREKYDVEITIRICPLEDH